MQFQSAIRRQADGVAYAGEPFVPIGGGDGDAGGNGNGGGAALPGNIISILGPGPVTMVSTIPKSSVATQIPDFKPKSTPTPITSVQTHSTPVPVSLSSISTLSLVPASTSTFSGLISLISPTDIPTLIPAQAFSESPVSSQVSTSAHFTGRLSRGAIAGLAVAGAVSASALVACLIFWLCIKRKKRRIGQQDTGPKLVPYIDNHDPTTISILSQPRLRPLSTSKNTLSSGPATQYMTLDTTVYATSVSASSLVDSRCRTEISGPPAYSDVEGTDRGVGDKKEVKYVTMT